MTASDRRIRIVHLAVDVNTPQRQRTTTAVEWFVESLDPFENVLIGMRRTPLAWRTRQTDCGTDRGYRLFDLPFFGLPFGIGLFFSMWLVARRTIALLEHEGLRPDIVHAHKLTFEGIAGWCVARHFGVPLFVSLRGEVETKIFRLKPTYRPLLRRICSYASHLYFVSAWFRDEYHRHVPAQPDKERRLPNIVRNISPTITPQPPGEAFVTILNLDTWKRKGLPWLIDGFARAYRQRPSLRMDIIGGGSADSIARAQKLITDAGLTDSVRLTGALPNADVLKRLPFYRGLLLPSRNETFGMVYVEALFAGIPILFTRGTAIDGYLDGIDVAVTVREGDVEAIAQGILSLDRETSRMRETLQNRAAELHARFDPDHVLTVYRSDIKAAVTE